MSPNLLKQPVDKRYLSLEDNLKLLETVPIPEPEKKHRKVRKSPKIKSPEVKPVVSVDEKPRPEPISLEGKIINVDLKPYSEKNEPVFLKKEDWTEKFNLLKRIMVSMPDLYLAGKSNNKKLFGSLREDFTESWEISSTRIIYNKYDLYGNIIHYFKSKVVKPKDSGRVFIPYYPGAKLDNVLNTNEGLLYLQTLFNTKDDADQISKTLQNLSGYDLDNIRVWTLGQKNRKFCSVAASGFHIHNNIEFFICGNYDSITGRSRSVRIINSNNSQNNGGSQ